MRTRASSVLVHKITGGQAARVGFEFSVEFSRSALFHSVKRFDIWSPPTRSDAAHITLSRKHTSKLVCYNRTRLAFIPTDFFSFFSFFFMLGVIIVVTNEIEIFLSTWIGGDAVVKTALVAHWRKIGVSRIVANVICTGGESANSARLTTFREVCPAEHEIARINRDRSCSSGRLNSSWKLETRPEMIILTNVANNFNKERFKNLVTDSRFGTFSTNYFVVEISRLSIEKLEERRRDVIGKKKRIVGGYIVSTLVSIASSSEMSLDTPRPPTHNEADVIEFRVTIDTRYRSRIDLDLWAKLPPRKVLESNA